MTPLSFSGRGVIVTPLSFSGRGVIVTPLSFRPSCRERRAGRNVRWRFCFGTTSPRYNAPRRRCLLPHVDNRIGFKFSPAHVAEPSRANRFSRVPRRPSMVAEKRPERKGNGDTKDRSHRLPARVFSTGHTPGQQLSMVGGRTGEDLAVISVERPHSLTTPRFGAGCARPCR